jgi:tRNA A64-2'-O-ribosylphosphate transferase
MDDSWIPGNQTIYDGRNYDHQIREEIRKETVDLFNRLHSVNEDIHFVRQIHMAFPSLPLIRELSTISH